MKLAATIASEMSGPGHRLDASYHASDGIRALRFLQEWSGTTLQNGQSSEGILKEQAIPYGENYLDFLGNVCISNGIFIPGRFKRYYVDDPDYGELWLSPSDMQRSELTYLKLVSKKHTPAKDSLYVHKDWILLSRSGTIGNSIYVRDEMDGLVGSDDIIRIISDPAKIKSGFLYAFISSKIGKALIEQKTYGAVVPHIEPHHIWSLPIPRFNDEVEQKIHELMSKASHLKSSAFQMLESARKSLFSQVDIPHLTRKEFLTKGLWCFSTPYEQYGQFTLNAWRYNPVTQKVLSQLESIPHKRLGALVEDNGIFYGHQFKRLDADPNVGIMLLSQTHTFQERPQGRWISKKSVPNYRDFIVPDDTILVAAQGTMGDSELFGRCQFSHRNFENHMITQHILRILPDSSKVNPGYLFAFLSSEYGFHLFRSTACGTKLMGFILGLVEQFPIPILSKERQEEIGEMVYFAYDNRADALQLEDKAQSILSEALGWKD
jgi:hypothetical protein